MLLEKFQEIVNFKPIIKVKKYDYRHRELIALKKSTKYIDFGCDFGKNGQICRGYQQLVSCCCCDCADHVGYLRAIEKNKIKRYARYFHQKYGFWRKGKGCILPREDRSPTCLTFSCRHMDYITDKEKEDGMAFYDAMRSLRQLMEGLEESLIAKYRV